MEHLFYIGAKGRNDSAGIYRLVFDDVTNELKTFSKDISGFSAEYLCFAKNINKLFSIGNEDTIRHTCEFSVFKTESHDGSLVKDYSIQLPFNGISHLLYSASLNQVFISIYVSGQVAILDFTSSLHISSIRYLNFSGSGPNRFRQNASHPHSVCDDLHGSLFIPDLGADRIHWIRYNGSSEYQCCDIVCPEGSGPRHMCILDNFAYIVCELSSELLVYNLSSDMCVKGIPSFHIPLYQYNKETNLSADIRSYGNQIAISNRGEQNVMLFIINNGKPQITVTCKTGGKTRNLRYGSDGKYLFCVNEEYDNSDGSVNIINTHKGSSVFFRKIPGAHCIEFIGGIQFEG